MQRLKERLEKAGVWTPRLESLVAALWKYGIDRIGETGLRETVIDYLVERAPLAFFTTTASQDPNAHTPWQQQVNGGLRGIVESCVLVPPMAKYVTGMLDASKQPIPLAVDVALAATIVTDTFRVDDEGLRPGSAHGRVAAGVWKIFALSKRKTYPFIIDKVADAVFWHYGVYTPEWREGVHLSPEAWLTHLCDAFTSRRELATIFEGVPNIE